MIARPNNPNFAPRRRRGFTLVELILVLALLVIVTSMTVPPLAKFIRGRALDSEARQLMSLMHAAQSRAVSESMPMMLWIDEKSGTYGMEAETSGQNGDPHAENLTLDPVLKISVQSTGTAGQAMFNNVPAIKYLPDGTVDETSPQSLTLQDVDGFGRVLGLNKLRTAYDISDTSGN